MNILEWKFMWRTLELEEKKKLFLFGCDLKQIDCHLFLQQRWVYLWSAENCNSGSTIMVSHVQVSAHQEKASVFMEGEKNVGRQ